MYLYSAMKSKDTEALNTLRVTIDAIIIVPCDSHLNVKEDEAVVVKKEDRMFCNCHLT